MNICILGCSGFVGYHLVKGLLQNNYIIYGIDIVNNKIKNIIHNNFIFLKNDISNLNEVEKIILKCDIIINLAAICNPSKYNISPIEVININYIKAIDIINLCLKHNKYLIQFSTSEVYGKTISSFCNNGDYVLNEENTPLILGDIKSQRWSYACAKQLLERTIYAYGYEKGLNWIIIRPFNFLGKKMDYIDGIDGNGIPRVFCCFIKNLLENKPLQLVNGGKSKRCFTYIDDAIDAILLIINNIEKCNKQIFNIGNPNNEISIKELAEIIINNYKEQYEFNAGTVDISGEEFYGKGYDDSDRRVPDIKKITNMLNWKPKTNIYDTIKKSLNDFIDEYFLK